MVEADYLLYEGDRRIGWYKRFGPVIFWQQDGVAWGFAWTDESARLKAGGTPF